jgi:hypothetical protein
MMGRRGPVLADRYHAHVLRTPAEVRNAVRYVVGSFANHAARRGERIGDGWVDPLSSAHAKMPREAQLASFPQPAVAAPRTWLLQTHISIRNPRSSQSPPPDGSGRATPLAIRSATTRHASAST